MSTEKRPDPRPSRFDKRTAPAARTPKPKRARGRPPKQALPAFRTKDRARSELARLAIDWPRVVLDDMAEACGTTRSSLAAYRTGQRRMPDAVARRLAQWLRGRAGAAVEVAEQLEDATRLEQDP